MQRVRYPLRHLFAMRAYGGNFYFDMRGSAIAIAAQCSIRFFDDTQLFGEIAVPCKSFRGSCSFFLRPARSLPASSLLPPSPRPDRPGPTLRWRMVRPNCVWSLPSPASFIHSLACLPACLPACRPSSLDPTSVASKQTNKESLQSTATIEDSRTHPAGRISHSPHSLIRF